MAVARRPVSRRRDEEPEEDEQPRRRPRDEVSEEDAERRIRGREDEDEQRPRARRARDEDEDERDTKQERTQTVRKGWEGARQAAAGSGDFAEEFKPSDKKSDLIKFLEPEPVASYRQHWIDNPPAPIRKKSYTCLEEDCPLCDIGDRPSSKTVFNVLHLTTGAEPVNKIWTVGIKVTKQLQAFDEDDKSGPLPRLYWSVKRSGTGSQSVTNLQPVKVRDLEDEWAGDLKFVDPDEDLLAVVEDMVEDAKEQVYDEKVVQFSQRSVLRDLAKALSED